MVRYCTSILLGAFLLFQIQPQIARTILPWFGGGSAVWSTCMLFFQVLLLGGYVYAHLLHRFLAPGKQAVLHAVLLAMSVYFLPVVPDASWRPTGGEDPTIHILLLLTATVGMPYLLLAATGPLLQSWFAREFVGRSPYRLYALSNLGSLAALLSFPFVFEPNVRIVVQSQVWSVVYVGFGILCVVCALTMARSYAMELQREHDASEDALGDQADVASLTVASSRDSVGAGRGVGSDRGIAAQGRGARADEASAGFEAGPAFAARAEPQTSGVAAEAGTALAEPHATPGLVSPGPVSPASDPLAASAVPSLIVTKEPNLPPSWRARLGWVALAALPSAMLLATTNAICLDIAVVPFLWVLPLSVYLLTFILTFDSDRFCRPGLLAPLLGVAAVSMFLIPPGWLLNYVGWQVGLSAGTLLLCGMVCHGQLVRSRPPAQFLTGFYLFISLGGALGGSFVAVIAPQIFNSYLEVEVCLLAAGLTAAYTAAVHAGGRWRPLGRVVLPVLLAACFGLGIFWRLDGGAASLEQERNFFGTLTVKEMRRLVRQGGGFLESKVVTLNHGRTIHGKQAFGRNLAEGAGMTYYWQGTGVAHALRRHPAAGSRGLRVGVIGLGAGTLAAYAKSGDSYTFFEIDPAIERVAEKHFTYLRDARTRGAEATVALGDARITLERAAAQGVEHRFDILVVDAFSSDAIPVHLLTEECASVYWRHLEKDGVLALHVSNRHLNLEPVARGLAKVSGKELALVRAVPQGIPGANTADWILITSNADYLAEAARELTSTAESEGEGQSIVWTDDFSSLWHVLK